MKSEGKNNKKQEVFRKRMFTLNLKVNAIKGLNQGRFAQIALTCFIALFISNNLKAQTFAAVQVNPFSLTDIGNFSSIAYGDLDADGDLDMISGETSGNFKYFQNTGTSSAPVFAAVVTNPFLLTLVYNYSNPTFADLDGDGDLDMMAGVSGGNFKYFENTGTSSAPAFAVEQTNPFSLLNVGNYPHPNFADLDGDGDLDMMVGVYAGSFEYFQNTGTSSAPSFAWVATNPFSLTEIGRFLSTTFGDLDGDGDLDVLAGDISGSFYYFQNTGTSSNPTFAAAQTNPFSLTDIGSYSSPTFVDLDDDGYLDIMAGENGGNFYYFKNTSLPTASPLSIIPDAFLISQTTCSDYPVNLTVNNSVGTTYWFEGTCNTINSIGSGLNITVFPNDTTTYFARNFENGIWSNNCASITINVLPPPTLSSNDTICSGETVILNESGNYLIYQWNDGLQNVSNIVNPEMNTTYNVTAYNNEYDCTAFGQVSIEVNNLPLVFAGNDLTLCYNFVDFTLVPANPLGGFWIGTGIDSSGFYSNHTIGTHSVTYKVIDANNCQNTDTLMVSISGNPLADFAYNSNTFCIDGTNPTPTVLFSQGGTFSCDNCVIDPFSGNIDLTSSGEGVFNVSYADANNCGNPIIKTITIVSSTQSSFSYIDVMCQDHSISPTLNSNSTVGIFTSTPNLNSLNLNSGEIDLTLESPGIYSISNTIITDGSCFSSQFSFNIEIFALPTVQITNADNILCLGDTVFMQANGASNYEWNNVLGTNSSVFDVPNTNKTYILKGIDLNSCENFDTLQVDVNNYPTLITSASQNICIGDSITLTASGAPFLNWNNSLPQGGNNLVFPTSTTQYQIIGIDENNCQDTSSILITVNSIDVANFNYNSSLFCIDDTNPFPINNGTPNGVFSGNTVINSNTGEIDLLNSGNGDFIVVYQTPGYCFRIDTFEVKIVDNFITDFSIPTSNCQVGNVFPVMTNNGLIGTFSSTPIGLNIDSQSGLINFELSANGIYSVTNTITGTGTCATSQYSNTIEILQSPIVNLNFQNDTAICIGQNLNLVANGATNFGWNNGLGVGANKTITPSTNTTVIVIGTNINGCNDADTLQVQINSLPNVSAGSDITLCYNQSYLFSGSGALTYTWNNGMINNMSWNAIISSSFTVTGTDLNGCQNTDQMNINVNPLPNVFAGNDVAVCQNQNISLAGAGAVNYSWNNGIINGQSFIPSSTLTYTVIGTDLNGCQNSDQVTVSINPLPIINAGNDTVICQNSDIILTGSGGVSYTWNNGVIDGQNFNPSSSLTYNVIGTDVYGCNNNDQVTVGVYNLPVVSAGNDFNICENSSVTLFGNGASTYIWNNGVLNGVAFNIQNSNVYTVTGTDVNGCQNTDQININVNPLPNVFAGSDSSFCVGNNYTLSGQGAVSYTWDNGFPNQTTFSPLAGTNIYNVIGTDANGCQNSDQLTLNVGNETFSQLYVSAINLFILNNIAYNLSGTYQQTILNANGCDSIITLNLIINYLGVNENNKTMFNVYPNPSGTGIFNIDIPSDLQISYELMDYKGNLLSKNSLSSTIIDISEFADGIYFLKLYYNKDNYEIVKIAKNN